MRKETFIHPDLGPCPLGRVTHRPQHPTGTLWDLTLGSGASRSLVLMPELLKRRLLLTHSFCK